jgi:hypothetical protein
MSPQEARQLAKRLFPEEFEKDRRSAILKALAWLDEAANGSDSAPATTASANSKRHPLVEQLATYITSYGLSYEVIGKQLGTSSTSIGGWLRGTTPKAGSLEKIRTFLKAADADTSARETTLSSRELFAANPTPAERLPE